MADTSKFPKLPKSITNFLTEEEGSISRNKILAVGSLMVIMTVLMAPDVYAKHSSHSSHRSHSSGSSHRSGHSSHESHVSHSSSSHSSHSSSVHSSHSSSTHNSHGSYTVNTHNSSGTQTTTTPAHTNTANVTTPTFKAPELYPLDSIHNKLLGTHNATTASGNTVAVANLKITDFKD